jgi:hypothetical protein
VNSSAAGVLETPKGDSLALFVSIVNAKWSVRLYIDFILTSVLNETAVLSL